MAESFSNAETITYADAGVDIDRANRTKKRIRYLAHKTFTRGVLSEIGGFGALFAIDKQKYLDPVLVSSVDGVGTKLKIAAMTNRHDTVGQDLVNHCVNDIAVLGAEPLYFLDYIGTGKLRAEVFNGIIQGLGHGLDEEARRVAQQIRFRPATSNGRPVDVTTKIHITFQLA